MGERVEHWFNRRYGMNRRNVFLTRTPTGSPQVLDRVGGAEGRDVTHYFDLRTLLVRWCGHARRETAGAIELAAHDGTRRPRTDRQTTTAAPRIDGLASCRWLRGPDESNDRNLWIALGGVT
jgi:hypothetical protein